jgi:uncharacterized membrane protein YjjP (DUF1212 family)
MTPPPTNLPVDKRDGVRFALKLGRALHIYGASATRLEAVMGVLSTELGLRGHFFSMPTALLASFELPGEEGFAHLFRLRRNEVDFDKLCRLDRLWNDVVTGQVSPVQGLADIDRIDEEKPLYGSILLTICFALSSGAASTFFGGGPREMALAALCGLLLGLFLLFAGPRKSLIGLHELLSASLVSFTAVIAGHFMGGASVDTATLAGIIILLPGFTLTTAVSELAQRNVVSGAARLAWSSLLLMMLGFGVMAGRTLGERLVGLPEFHEVISWPSWIQPTALMVAGITLGILFQAQKRDLPWITAAAMLPYLALEAGIAQLGLELGVFLAALLAGAGSNLYARVLDRPATITRLPGILILVPGSIGFLSITELMKGDPLVGLEQGFQMLTTAFSLVSGLLVSNAVIPPRKAL